MGQYWVIAAPSRGQRLDDDGKLPELFWNGAGSGLQRQLMVPQGKSSHQDTLVLSKLQSYLDALYSPREEANTAATAHEERDDFAGLMTQLGRVPLRGEARVCVGEFLNSDDMLPLMRLYFATSFGAWAGEQIVCVGDYAETSPQELYVQGEKKRSLYNRTVCGAQTQTGSYPLRLLLCGLKQCCKDKVDAFLTAYTEAAEEHFPSDQTYIACNLTDKEYMRLEEDIVQRNLDDNTDKANDDAGNAILSHICWTDDPSTSMDYDFDHLLHGPWAGHRFKILPISALEKLITEDEGWQDVTEELYDVVDEIFDAIG